MTEEKTYRVRSRVLAEPRGADKAKQLEYALKRRRRQKKSWPQPDDAMLILPLHFNVYSFSRQSFHAEACMEIPTKKGFEYFTVSGGGRTQFAALRQVIEKIEASDWFHQMKEQKVYFKITGGGMEEIYRGYL
ncbi:hypothetical protein [Xanthomonas phage BUDD]|nr:hypothetical protein [Xanthomonas phage BUDD]